MSLFLECFFFFLLVLGWRALRPKPLPLVPCVGGARLGAFWLGLVGLSSAAARARALASLRPCALLSFLFAGVLSWRGALTFPSLWSVGMAPRVGWGIVRLAAGRLIYVRAAGAPCGQTRSHVVRSAGRKCGAVVPHCDFQKHLPQIALKQRVLPFARTRIGRAPPRPRLCALRRYPGRALECNTPRDSGKRTDPKRLTPHFPKFSKFYKQKPLMKVCLRILNY